MLHFLTLFKSWDKTERVGILDVARWESSWESCDAYFVAQLPLFYCLDYKTRSCFPFEIWVGGDDEFKFFLCWFDALEEICNIEISDKYSITRWYSTSEDMIDPIVSSSLLYCEHIKVLLNDTDTCMISWTIIAYAADSFWTISKSSTYLTSTCFISEFCDIACKLFSVSRIARKQKKCELCRSIFSDSRKKRDRVNQFFECFWHYDNIYYLMRVWYLLKQKKQAFKLVFRQIQKNTGNAQKREIRGRKIFSKWAYWCVSNREINFYDEEVRSFSVFP